VEFQDVMSIELLSVCAFIAIDDLMHERAYKKSICEITSVVFSFTKPPCPSFIPHLVTCDRVCSWRDCRSFRMGQ